MDIYAEITNRIIAELEKGNIPWHKPWLGVQAAVKHTTGEPYSLLNQLILDRPGEYLTCNQCKKEGGSVKKGAKAKMVVFWKWIPTIKKDKDGNIVYDADGKPVEESFPFLRYFQVFHIDDCEGITARHTAEENRKDIEPDEAAEEAIADYLKRSGVKMRHEEQDRAYYRPSIDTVVLPLKNQFKESAEYYSTAFHELTHSTGHKSRLNRLTQLAAFGSEVYSKEELVAEIGASVLMQQFRLETPESFRNNAAYIQSWLDVLKNDKRMIVSAAGRAEKATNMILGI